MIDCELRKNAQQIYVGCTSEPNTLTYWKGILGKKAEDLKKLENGQFVYFNRNKIGKIQIEPYDAIIQKQQIVTPQIKSIEPITTHQNTNIIPVAKLFILLGFAILALNSLR